MANGAQGTLLNWDPDDVKTSFEFGNDGSGTSRWHAWVRVADGGFVPIGALADAAVTNPAASASVIAALKGILSRLNLGATGLLKGEDNVAASGDYGVMALAVRRDAPTSDAAAGDYHALHVDALGRLRIVGTFAEDVAHVSGDYGNFILGVANTGKTAFSATGDYTPIATGLAGETFVATVPEANASWALSNIDSAALEASKIIKAGAGKLFKLTVHNTLASIQYIQLYDSTTLPANGVAPAWVYPIAASGSIDINFTDYGRYFSTGIVVGNSTTLATKTIGAADCWFQAQYL